MKVFIIFIGILFWLEGITFLDPDFGWHLQMGNLVLEKGIPKTDPFSYTMPNFPFIDHEWLTNVGIAKLYPLIGTWGLSLITAFLGLAALIISMPTKLSKWTFIPFLLSVTIIFGFIGIRVQVLTWVFLSLLLKVTLKSSLWLKWRFFTPLLFILWTNLHGGFASGILVLAVILTTKAWEEKRINFTNLLILFFSTAATLINPYGVRIWGEVWMQISDGSLRFWISEWAPMLFNFNIAFLILFSLSLVLILRFRKKLGLTKVSLYFGLLIAGLSSSRHIPLWVIATLPLVLNCLDLFYQEIKNNKISVKRFNLIYKVTLGLVLFTFIFNSYYTLKSSLPWAISNYPNKAIAYLKAHPSKGQLFALYDWGGYLTWQFPEKKVFIDGRMPSWRWESPDKSKSNWAFEEFKTVFLSSKDYKQNFNKYNINTALLEAAPKHKKKNLLDLFNLNIFKSAPLKSLQEKLKEDGWKKVYEDEIAVIYQR